MKQLTLHILTGIVTAGLLAVATGVQGQDNAPGNAIAAALTLSPEQVMQISGDMTEYIGQITEVEEQIATARLDELKDLQNQVQSIDVQWQAYTQIEQVDITASPTLMELLALYKLAYTTTCDSITAQQKKLQAAAEFQKASDFLAQCRMDYLNMEQEALEYALVPQSATMLADVKAKEALLFAQVTENYQKALAASQLSAEVKAQMPELEQAYIEISKISEKIKSTQYKPLITRIKDYVLTFAGVAIILIFLNFVVTKIKAIKQAKEMAKKYSNMLNGGDDYPTI